MFQKRHVGAFFVTSKLVVTVSDYLTLYSFCFLTI